MSLFRAKPSALDLLVKAGRLERPLARRLQREAQQTARPVCELLLQAGAIDEAELFAFLAERLEVPTVGAEALTCDEDGLAALPDVLRDSIFWLPISRVGNTLTLAMADPSDRAILERLNPSGELKIRPMLAPLSALREIHQRLNALRQLRPTNANGAAKGNDLAPYLGFFEKLEDFRFETVIGQGGFGLVCRCLQPALERYVAIKVLNPDYNTFDQVSERFKREGQIIAQLDHPNIIRVYEQGAHQHFRYIVMEYFEGQPIDRYLAQCDWGRKLSVLIQVCQALAYAHRRGVIHRDIKPANILVNRQGAIKLLDFGVAHFGAKPSDLTTPQVIIGTPKYMAPELNHGADKSSPASDLYAFGIMAYEILTAKPFHPERIRRPQHLNSQIPDYLGDAILRCLSPNAENRPRSFELMASTLQQAMDELLFGEITQDRQLDATRSRKTRLQRLEETFEFRAILRQDKRCRTVLGYNHRMGREVVIKMMEHPAHADRLNRYAELKAFNVGEIYGVGRHGPLILLVTEHLSGGPLAARLNRPLPPLEIVTTLQGVISALDHAARAGFGHGHLHPDNILFSGEGAVKLVDFGLTTGCVNEFERYLPPRTFPTEIDADRHSLGVLLFELTTVQPWPGGRFQRRYEEFIVSNPAIHPLLKYFAGRFWAVGPGRPEYEDYSQMLLDLERIHHRIAAQPRWDASETHEPHLVSTLTRAIAPTSG